VKETDLCAWFQGVAEEAGYTVYNEWGGFDQLLVAADGTQIGVEAKLRANSEVLSQAANGWHHRTRKDWIASAQFRAVLVPRTSKSFRYVSDCLGVIVFAQRDYEKSRWRRKRFWELPTAEHYQWGEGVELPPFVPDVMGGKRAPVRLTPWKIKAIRLCIRLRDNGYVTIRDFKEFGVSPTRWYNHWLTPGGKEGRATKWVLKHPAGSDVVLPDEQHPGVTAQIRAAEVKDV
jgi:hypothetical protein